MAVLRHLVVVLAGVYLLAGMPKVVQAIVNGPVVLQLIGLMYAGAAALGLIGAVCSFLGIVEAARRLLVLALLIATPVFGTSQTPIAFPSIATWPITYSLPFTERMAIFAGINVAPLFLLIAVWIFARSPRRTSL